MPRRRANSAVSAISSLVTLNGAAAGDPAAIAIPLLTASGCVGVMAAELRQNRPHVDLLPVARILGAQFSSLITPAEEPRRSAHA